MTRILSFDIEEWFHLLEVPAVREPESWESFEVRLPANVETILDVADAAGVTATFFCLGWVARRFPQVVRKIAERGHEIGSHSDLHRLVHEQSRDEFAADLRASKDALQQATGAEVRAFRAPGFSLVPSCNWAFEVLIEQGFAIDCSIFPASRAHGGYPSFPRAQPTWVECRSGRIKEFPINTLGTIFGPVVFSGGGYFRLLPRPCVRLLAARSSYTMSYFHPRDFDAGQPRLGGLSALRRFKSYYGLRSAEAKLRDLLEHVPFTSLAEADARIDWDAAPVVRV